MFFIIASSFINQLKVNIFYLLKTDVGAVVDKAVTELKTLGEKKNQGNEEAHHLTEIFFLPFHKSYPHTLQESHFELSDS